MLCVCVCPLERQRDGTALIKCVIRGNCSSSAVSSECCLSPAHAAYWPWRYEIQKTWRSSTTATNSTGADPMSLPCRWTPSSWWVWVGSWSWAVQSSPLWASTPGSASHPRWSSSRWCLSSCSPSERTTSSSLSSSTRCVAVCVSATVWQVAAVSWLSSSLFPAERRAQARRNKGGAHWPRPGGRRTQHALVQPLWVRLLLSRYVRAMRQKHIARLLVGRQIGLALYLFTFIYLHIQV